MALPCLVHQLQVFKSPCQPPLLSLFLITSEACWVECYSTDTQAFPWPLSFAHAAPSVWVPFPPSSNRETPTHPFRPSLNAPSRLPSSSLSSQLCPHSSMAPAAGPVACQLRTARPHQPVCLGLSLINWCVPSPQGRTLGRLQGTVGCELDGLVFYKWYSLYFLLFYICYI